MLPKHVMICGKKIKVVVKDLDGDTWAQYCHDKGEIQVDVKTEAGDPEAAWQYLLHEIVHAVLNITGVSEVFDIKQEEAICRSLENLSLILGLR